MRVAAELSICVDCLQFIANGPDELSPDVAAACAAGVEREGGHVVPNCPENCEGWFSWSPCDLCNRPEGGERHPAAVLVDDIPLDPMTADEAREYAPQWGSYMTAGDPGAVMYGAIPPECAEHRDAMIRHIKSDLYPLALEADDGPDEESEYEWNDSQMLRRLVAYLESIQYPAGEVTPCTES